ncbi:hypothetical protein J8N05_11215 [Streptomyces sp. BH-SS-21]|uniref:Gram-positive cocci surface proteins LPxTG domain-containing protein n=1 Tax=Streptomyces liliiviolaceus TaxID=2823109 RepID=A0A940XQQ5_9ACTN|nr:hypothetical protein [Streptomyces liliiviolaceus]
MRLSKPLSLAVTAAAALTSVPEAQASAQASAQVSAQAQPGAGPACAVSGKRDFPVRTRIHGGPDAYEAGGGFRIWYIDLTNTTDTPCENVHPVVVLVDEKRALRPEQPRLEFYDGEQRPRPVTFERTDEDEHIGVLGSSGPGSPAPDSSSAPDSAEEGDFPGFTVAPGKTLSIKVRLAVTSDAVANDIVANAAVVQRHRDDGSWVGQSNDYRFRIVGGVAGGKETGEPRGDTGVRDRDRQGAADGVPDGLPSAGELAGTGLSSPRALLAAAGGALLLLTAGATALVLARRRR